MISRPPFTYRSKIATRSATRSSSRISRSSGCSSAASIWMRSSCSLSRWNSFSCTGSPDEPAGGTLLPSALPRVAAKTKRSGIEENRASDESPASRVISSSLSAGRRMYCSDTLDDLSKLGRVVVGNGHDVVPLLPPERDRFGVGVGLGGVDADDVLGADVRGEFAGDDAVGLGLARQNDHLRRHAWECARDGLAVVVVEVAEGGVHHYRVVPSDSTDKLRPAAALRLFLAQLGEGTDEGQAQQLVLACRFWSQEPVGTVTAPQPQLELSVEFRNEWLDRDP